MSYKHSRKEFIKLSALAGAGFLFATCGGNKKEEDDIPIETDTLNQIITKENFKYTVDLIDKENERYETLRKGFNKRINTFPKIIALCKSTQDVVEAIQYAKIYNLPAAIKSGGHSMEGFSSNNDGMVINLSQLNTVEFLDDHNFKVGPGCTLAQLYDTILPKNRLIPAGSCATVGIGGLTLGGGYGLFARQFGLTCDHLLEATLVSGKGEVISTKSDPELLWALRGGGAGNFGVVTEMIFKSQEAPQIMRSYHFKARRLDAVKAKSILENWFTFATVLPETCFSAFVLNGKTLTVLVTNTADHTKDLQKNLDSFAQYTDEFTVGAALPIAKKLKNYYGSLIPVNFKNSSAGLYSGYEEIENCIESVFEKIVSTPGMIYQLNTLGGKINAPGLEQTACYPHRALNYISELQAYWDDESKEEKLKNVSKEILEIFKDNGITSQYINYCSRDFSDWEQAYYGSNYRRLQAIKDKYDSNNVIQYPQSIRPTKTS